MDRDNVNNAKNRRRTNIFLVFLACSALIWLISKLSENYSERVSFDITYNNSPDSLLFARASKDRILVRLEANGFQFLSFNIGKNELQIDLSQVKRQGNSFYVDRDNYRNQIENQLTGNMKLQQLEEDTLFVYFEKLFTKTVKVVPDLTLNLAPNHLLEGELVVEPPSVQIKGPKQEIASVNEVYTVGKTISEISDDFSITLDLARWASLDNTSFSQDTVKIEGQVFRFFRTVDRNSCQSDQPAGRGGD